MLRIVFALLLLGLCQAQVKEGDGVSDSDLAKLLEEIFGKPSSTQAPDIKTTTSTVMPFTDAATKEEAVEADVLQCRTMDGIDGLCTLASRCTKPLSPNRKRKKMTLIASIAETENEDTIFLSEYDIWHNHWTILINVRATLFDKANCAKVDEVCCSFLDMILIPVQTTPSNAPSGCGWRNGNTPRILSDNDRTTFAEFPWIVAVLTIVPQDPDKPDGTKIYLYTCGGSIIHPQVVLTTAHFVYQDGIKLRVRAGEWDTNSTLEELPYQDRNVQSIMVHERYNKKRQNLHFDVALLVLETPLDLTFNVQPICLPPAGQRTAAGVNCFSSGWGKNKFGKNGSYQTILKKVEVPVISRPDCQKELRKTRLGTVFKLHDSFMCAGGQAERDTCTGDGGSPLMCPIQGSSGRYTASGMVAWGVGCGNAVPAVYADVSTFRTWVDMKMVALSFDTSFYTY